MQKVRKKVLVFGYIALNVGDDYFFDILFKRYPQVDFYFFPPSTLLSSYLNLFGEYKNVIMYQEHPEYLRLRHAIPDVTIPLNLFSIICETAKEMDAFINIGGSLFIQSDGWKQDDRFVIKKLMRDKPCFILGCNFGPGDNEYRNYFAKWFKGFRDVCFRDQYSYKLFSKNSNSRLADDIVLIKKKRFSFPLRREKRIGISVVEISGRRDLDILNRDDYILYHVQKVREYLNDSKNYKVTFYSFCHLDGDTHIIYEIINHLTEQEKEKVEIVQYDGSLKKFLKHYEKCELIIGSRLHSILIAIANNQDFIPVSYSQKIDRLLKQMDDTIVPLKIDGTLQQRGMNEERYNMKRCKFNSKLQFQKLDEYFK